MAYSEADSAGLFVLYGNPNAAALDIIRIRKGQIRQSLRPQPCEARERRGGKLTAFLIGGLGTPAAVPFTSSNSDPALAPIPPGPATSTAVSLVFSNRTAPLILDPARHTVASQPALKFRMSELRPDTRVSGILKMRVLAPAAAGRNVALLVIFGSVPGQSYEAQLARPVAPGIWDVNLYRELTPDVYLHVYLIER